ncbi:hypothetical protein [Bacillus alkalicellulosilyticus]|uniref:hypothetical protein n=1 Tax=Alkalihalobacterium alkalicellulosilyticum TaxID=1912214 RepID=UPI0009971400|nr:hypothetical protein [Bacillus alkalicellulosilyticus]
MKCVGIWVVSLLIVVLVVGVTPLQTEALSCNYLSIEEELEKSDLVFKGKVVRVGDGYVNQKYTFDVKKVWKGDHNIGEELVLDKGFINFNEGVEYIVFAQNIFDNQYFVTPTLCGNTNEASFSLEWKLGSPTQGMHMLTPWLISLGIGCIVFIIYVIKRKRKRS